MPRSNKSRKNNSGKKPIEQYEHKDKKRTNNPPVGLVTPESDPPDPPQKTYAYDPHLDPQLEWAGKAERMSFEVPTVSLHVHERIDPRTIIEAARKNGSSRGALRAPAGGQSPPLQIPMFESPAENPPFREAIDFYKHAHNWSNRLIAGDSLLVMNSLLEKEGMAGQVQMVYIDPPYGIKYGSNFQPFVNKRDVKDGKDEDLTQEPEMIRAFRDTWELGIHSYLSYLRDRLWLAKEMLNESGSCFVQISDENVHLVRDLCDGTFGPSNFVALIAFQKTSGQTAQYLAGTADYLVWYARDHDRLKYRSLHIEKRLGGAGGSMYQFVEMEGGERRRLTSEELRGELSLPSGAKVYRLGDITSQRQGRPSGPGSAMYFPVVIEGEEFFPPGSRGWTTTKEGMERLKLAGRLVAQGSRLAYVRYLDDFPAFELGTVWTDTAGTQDRIYVVQTSTEVAKRALLMTTDPGDLVFDPTCGSGTTAYVAEQWGRRWITCDTSRVAVTLAKQRLMTAIYDYYELAHPEEGVGSGFKYKTVPHVTLKSIANNEPPAQETLYDQPFVDKGRARVSGPFTVEAVPAPTVKSIGEIASVGAGLALPSEGAASRAPTADTRLALPSEGAASRAPTADTGLALPSEGAASRAPTADGEARDAMSRGETAGAGQAPPLRDIARSGETLRQSEWRDVLLKGGVRGKGGQKIEFSRVEPLGGTRWLHADAETKGVKAERVLVSFGPEYAPLEQRQVELAWEEARQLSPRPAILLFVYSDIDPEAGKDIAELTPAKTGMTFLAAKIDADVWTKDLKKKARVSPSVWLVGQPDVELRPVSVGAGLALPSAGSSRHVKNGDVKSPLRYVVEVCGFDYFNTKTGTIESGDTSKIAMWLLDTDYDGRSLYPRQVFFPMADEDEGWARLAKNLKAEIDPDLIQAYRGTVSLPFEPGQHKRIAVKIVDDRGIESLRIVEVK
ncbi:MAG TPA: site-specific DNA-methyltransferase [Terriglobia bacterium]|nr:site-specific DNA-methyltransferase [Terriglobia bacterium]